jgi:Fe-S cluster assembly protein SufD
MIDVMDEKEVYLADFARFEKQGGANGQSWVQEIRQAAIDRFAELGFPTTREEEWRFTSVAPLAQIPFQAVGAYGRRDLTVEQLQRVAFGTAHRNRLVFVNGHYAPDLSSLPALPPGVVVTNLAAALETHPAWVEVYLAKYASYENHAFTALNTAFLKDGAFVYLPKDRVLAEPLHLLFVSTTGEEATVAHPRNLIVAGAQSQLTLVESYVGLKDDVYFTNAVTELIAGPGAIVDHYKLQRESQHAFHVATLHIHQDRGSNISSHYVGLGGSLVRNEIHAVLAAEGCACTLNGLYLADGTQLMDNHTVIDHAKPHCPSHELYKGILNGKARGVFNGKIFVRQDAQKTDAKQTNQTLLLSEDATINTKPQLEIYADDVKCTHGATVGQLDEESIFYLRSRGIGLEAARSLLTFAFANDIISRIRIEPIRTYLENYLLTAQHLPASHGQLKGTGPVILGSSPL